jgi:phenylpyruvate tautomerase PptA (4-oxalocrotonate tautomerase family)
MAQVKIYGLADRLNPIKARMSDAVHACVVEALRFPADKRAHRFFPMDPSDFFSPAGRTDAYTIVEISLFEGRSVGTKKALIQMLFQRFERDLGIRPADLEITLTETPRHNWGFRGQSGDDVALTYDVEV